MQDLSSEENMKKLYDTFFRQGPGNEKFEKFSFPISALVADQKQTQAKTEDAQVAETLETQLAGKRKRKRNKKKKENGESVVQAPETEHLIIDDDADLSGDQMVADFELKLQ
jgi:hypothetical protein